MHKREWAQRFLRLLIFFVFFVLFVDSALISATAQEATATPESLVATPGETALPVGFTPSPLGISFPVSGQTLQGLVIIIGTADSPGLSAWDLAFSYPTDTTGTWFALASSSQPITTAAFASWDTSAITDGDYVLRLRISTVDGGAQDYLVPVRVRNYIIDTPTPTLTFTPTTPPEATALPTSTPAPTFTPYPTPTPLPPNPATLGANEIVFNLGRGAVLILMLFGIFGLFLRLRRR